MLKNALIAIGVGATLLCISEYLWRKKILRGEVSRKLLHILSGSWAAYWPWLLSFQAIIVLSLLAAVPVLLSRYHDVFRSLHRISRKTYGEVVVAIGVSATAGLLAAFENTTVGTYIFAISMLHLSIADGLAALVGKHFKTKAFYILGKKSTLAGTGAFIFTSITIQAVFLSLTLLQGAINAPLVVGLVATIAATIAEASSPRGTDNVTIPIVVCCAYLILS
jgi:phytol kinase